MAGKPKDMSKVKQILLLHRQGISIKGISRSTGAAVNTVRSYLRKLEASPKRLDELLKLENPALEAFFFSGNPSYKEEERYNHLKTLFSRFAKEIKKPGVTKQLLWEEYRQSYRQGYAYSQFCFHFGQYLKAKHPSMVLRHAPGEKLFIDFAGKPMHYIDPETGEEIPCQVFVACLPFSDYTYVQAVHSQKSHDFLYALEQCLLHLGGAPQTLVPDNLKAAVVRADRYEPRINKQLEDFATHYHTTVTPARAARPKDKALVENQVKIVYNRVYARLRNQRFFSLEELNAAISKCVRRHNQTRMQHKDHCREEAFLYNEKRELRPLPLHRFEVKYYRDLKVAQNNHVFLSQDRHHYSVPYRHIGSKAKVVYTRSKVSIFIKGELVASHPRKRGHGYSTVAQHLCSQHQHYRNRSPQYYLKRAQGHPVLQRYIKAVFSQKRYPEQLYKTCDGIFSLHRKVDHRILDSAMELALAHGQLSYAFLSNMIKNRTYALTEEEQEQKAIQHQNIRGKERYA